MGLKKYTLRVPVKSARGYQFWEVEAESPEDALKIWESGSENSHFVDEELEITDLGEPEIEEITD